MDYKKMLRAALKELEVSVKEMVQQTDPATPLPRLRNFVFASSNRGQIFWPGYDSDYANMPSDTLTPFIVSYKGKDGILNYSLLELGVSTEIIKICRNQPRQILRTLRRIQAATAWCYARAEGRKRMADEILRQQKTAIETLEVEAALNSLKE